MSDLPVPPGITLDELITPAEACRLLGYASANTLYPYVHSKALRTVKHGRIYYTTWRDIRNTPNLPVPGRGRYIRGKESR